MAAGWHRIIYISIKRIGLRANVYGPPQTCRIPVAPAERPKPHGR